VNYNSINEQIGSMVLKESSNQEDESIIKKALKDLSMGGGIVFQFGTGIGAFMGPVRELLLNHGVSVSKENVALLLITSVYLMGDHSKDELKVLYKKLKERDLDMYVDDVTDFINKSKSILTKIASKMGKTVSSLIDALGFTFILVPTMDILHNLIMNNGLNFDSFTNMFSGIALSLTSYILKSFIDKKGLKEEIDSDWDWAKETLDTPVIKIKTKDEFIEEYGENWLHAYGIDWNSPHMDYLHGQSFGVNDVDMSDNGDFKVYVNDKTTHGQQNWRGDYWELDFRMYNIIY
jgi:hypothetical protein